eukprot:scaffold364463_cov36-Prasinocladus_malaysianus.AAC.1
MPEGPLELADALEDVLGLQQVVSQADEQRCGGLVEQVVRDKAVAVHPADVADVLEQGVASLPARHKDRVGR